MVRPSGSGGGDGIDETSAKHLLDSIGKIVHDKVKTAANYVGDLKGSLTSATEGSPELIETNETCDLVQKYYNHVNGGGGNRDPCGTGKNAKHEKVKRFSNTLGGQCTYNRIKDSNKNDNKGACAPYRRLYLCDKNLEQIKAEQITTHNLLAEVCMAAYYEGDLIKTHYTPYQKIYKDTGSGFTICTALARSFADIGDILRGKDLYLGNDDEERKKRKQLENNLKTIFKNIYEKLLDDNKTSGKKKALQARYEHDAPDYYQLREDWWYANRSTVWKAITCKAEQNDKYFRDACSGGKGTKGYCRCDGDEPGNDRPNTDPPTYFDYVPQFLRWFEEWAEDFCRLRKHKLKDVIEKCRYPNSSEKYCDLNRYDCARTIRGDHDFVEDEDCKDCQYSCARFVNWIDNQKLEFEKQKKKYDKEIKKANGKNGTSITIGKTTINNIYAKEFYKKLKQARYKDVEKFLEKLNEERICKDEPKVKEEKADAVDFTEKKMLETFCRTKYCQACPWCGAQKENGGKGWKAKNDADCGKKKHYDPKNITEIPVLTPDKSQSRILDKYKNFCANGKNGAPGATGTANGGDNSDNATTGYCGTNIDSSLCEKWTCYYKEKENNDGKKAINFCVLQDGNENTKYRKDKSYNVFFWDWVYYMLHDSLDWRKQLGSCINKDNGNTCISGCNKKCDCFLQWVQQKEKEWKQIIVHFYKQEDIRQEGPLGSGLSSPDVVLELLLEKELLLKSIKDTHANADDIDRIDKMLQETAVVNGGGVAALGGTEPDVDDDSSPKKRDTRTNPCYGDKQYPVLAEKVAQKLQQEAKEQLASRADRSALRADASEGHYSRGGEADDIKNGAICKITAKHSNDSRPDGEPCHGKDKPGVRFEIGTKWETGPNVQMTETEAYMPPRRRHMCTSNLENLDVGRVTENGKASHSLLGDVLLAANKQAEDIKKKYQENKDNNGQNGKNAKNGLTDKKTVCRAMKYSFADIGDIIKGRDLWDKDVGMQKLEPNLKKIFEKIKGTLTGDIQKKYKKIDDDKHTKLRSDWWEANRDQVWKAMTCPKSGITCGSSDHTPLHDYIPQRLRWMTEWAEWFCKEQSRLYDKLNVCEKCMDNGKCKQGNGDCEKCKNACEAYRDKIKTWENQWKQLKAKYEELYGQAKTTSTNPGPTVFNDDDPDYQLMVEFFKELQKEIKNSDSKRPKRSTRATTTDTTPNTPYSTAAGYIHQELPITGCMKQNVFCSEAGEKYAFKEPPHGYDTACSCDKNERPPPPPMTCVEEIAKKLREEAEGKINNELKGNGKDFNGKCNNVKKKNDAGTGEESCKFENTYKNSLNKISNKCEGKGMNRLKIDQEWNCKYIKDIGKHLCIPPRRKEMCIHKLNDIGRYNVNNSNDLLQKLQEIAQHEGDDIIRKLLEQNSCDEHRICDAMKYSFADLGDIIRGRDLLIRNGEQGRIKTKFKNLFTEIYSNLEPSKQKKYQKDITNLYELRSDWWDANRKHIWNAMTCNAPDAAKFLKKDENVSSDSSSSKGIFSNDPKCRHLKDPPDYDYIPQPFRWTQEWSEYYCKARINEIEKLQTECNECTSGSCESDEDGKKCEKCKTKCKSFNDFVQQWQRQFNIQSQTYKELYDKAMKNNSDGTATPSNDKSVEGPRSQKDRGKPRAAQEDDSITIEFLKQVKVKCKDPNNADKYLDKIANCPNIKFTKNGDAPGTAPSGASGSATGDDRNDAFENPPKDYKDSCNCKAPEPLDNCPDGNTNTYEKVCKSLSATNVCTRTNFNNNDDYWTVYDVRESTEKNKGVLVPPRRRKLCIRNITSNLNNIDNKGNFKKKFLQYAYTQGHYLSNIYKHDNENAIDAMRYSFYDYGDIVKGTDLISTTPMDNLKKKLNELLKVSNDNEISKDRGKWWTNNRTQVWHAMLCGYQKGNTGGSVESDWCSLPKEDETDQFLRWFREWTEHFCARQKELYQSVKKECESSTCDSTNGKIDNVNCEGACVQYKNYIIRKREEYRLLIHQYNVNYKEQKAEGKNAPEYFKEKSDTKYGCLSEYFNEKNKWENPYETLGNDTLKNKCDCIKTEAPPEGKLVPDQDPTKKEEIPPARPAKPDVPAPEKPLPPPTPSTDNTSDILSKKRKNGKNTPSDTQNDIQNDGIPSDIPNSDTPPPITDDEWNTLKHDFISQYLQSEQPNDVPNDYSSGDIPFNTQPNTLYFEKPQEKPFITSIHDRDLYTGEEYSYDMSTNSGENNLYSGQNNVYSGIDPTSDNRGPYSDKNDPISDNHHPYSGIDLINDSLSGEPINIYDELLKRKENELFGTNHVKQTSIHSVAKITNSDPIHNQLELFHTWLDRHRDMCEKWENHHERLAKLKEEWENETHSGDINSGIPSVIYLVVNKVIYLVITTYIVTYHTC
ncbi:hypothetical protein PFBG_02748 [Plasmodium falciparum 7G8]|uniref:Erythrocyte membrane protein 1 n=1 Tax=Plasmodium falciparum (isolate 7G8) TaxID=57266 RepID=W7F178_PLAF8|nr:hypothetical protein PFBG_02748 [Plasmodium falciparum 7G8]